MPGPVDDEKENSLPWVHEPEPGEPRTGASAPSDAVMSGMTDMDPEPGANVGPKKKPRIRIKPKSSRSASHLSVEEEATSFAEENAVGWSPTQVRAAPVLVVDEAPTFKGGWSHVLLGVAVVALSLVAGSMAVKRAVRAAEESQELVPVVVALMDMAEGTKLDAAHIAIRNIPAAIVTKSVVHKADSGGLGGRTLSVSVLKGDPLLWTQLMADEATRKLSPFVKRGARAYSIEVDDYSGVGRMIRPDDEVDLLLTLHNPKSANSDERLSMTLLQKVQVVSTGKMTPTTNVHALNENDRNYGEVSLSLLPEEAELVALAAEAGKIRLVLRSLGDTDSLQTQQGSTTATFVSGERVKFVSEQRAKAIEFIRTNSAVPQ